MQDLQQEIWTQNSINYPLDWTATIRSLQKGETQTPFTSALLEVRTKGMEGNNVEAPATTVVNINQPLLGVANSISPHRARKIQQSWMTSGMKKLF